MISLLADDDSGLLSAIAGGHRLDRRMIKTTEFGLPILVVNGIMIFTFFANFFLVIIVPPAMLFVSFLDKLSSFRLLFLPKTSQVVKLRFRQQWL